MIRYILLLFLFCCIEDLIQAQDFQTPKNRFSTSVFQRETIIEPINGNVQIDRFIKGIYYQRNLKYGIRPIIGFEHGEMGVNDNCIDCVDNFYGKGLLKETSFILGVRYNFLKNPFKSILPLLQLDLFYSSSKYSGNFKGGISSGGYQFEDIYDKYGIIGKIGLDINIIKSLFITIYTNYRIGTYTKERITENITKNDSYSNWIPIELRIGVDF